MITLAAGITTARAFKLASRYGWQFKGGVQGAGRGAGGTVLRLLDKTSTSRKLIPAKVGDTNPLYVVRVVGSNIVVAGLTIDGGVQGHLYNGLRVEKSKAPILHDLRVVRVPGDDDVPPGETFGINGWQLVGPVLHDIEIDGAGVGASGVGYNSSSGGSTTRVTAHDHPHCKGLAFWQHKGGHVIDHYESLHNSIGLGFERCEGEYVIRHSKFIDNARAIAHIASDTVTGRFHFIDPILGGNGRLPILLSATELKKPNRQRRSDVILTIDGRDRPDLIDFYTHR